MLLILIHLIPQIGFQISLLSSVPTQKDFGSSEKRLCPKQHLAFPSNDRKCPVLLIQATVTRCTDQTCLFYPYLCFLCNMEIFYLKKKKTRGGKAEKHTVTIKTHVKEVILSHYIWNWNFLLRPSNVVLT